MVFRPIRIVSLRAQLVLAVAGAALLVSGLGAWLQANQVRHDLEAAEMRRSESLVHALKVETSSGLSIDELNRVVMAHAAARDVGWIAVVQGRPPRIVASSRALWRGADATIHLPVAALEAYERGKNFHFRHEDTLVLVQPAVLSGSRRITDGFEHAGIVVQLRTRALENAQLRDATQRVAFLFLLVGLLVATVIALLQTRLWNRLDRMRNVVDSIEHGDLSARIEVGHADEVGCVAQALNQLLDRIEIEQARWRSVIDTAADGIVIIDSMGTIQTFNLAAERMFGHRQSDVVGHNVSMLMPSPFAEAHDDHIDRHMSSGNTAVLGRGRELPGLRRNGEVFPLHLSLSRMSIDGEVFFTGILRDVSEPKRIESELRKHAEALREANARALEATASKSAFLANMSHEIRTPMTAILGYLDLLEDEGVTEEQRKEYLSTVRTNGQHLLTLINDILDLSKVEAGRIEVERLPVDLPALVREVQRSFEPRASQKRLEFGFTVEGRIPTFIHTDPVRLRQILVNLIGNALKFTETGGVDVTVRAGRNGGEPVLRFAVTDTGIGMSTEQVERLFKPFSQGDASTTRRFGGTGLGLVISQRLAQLLGGGIEVESRPGEGSTFTLTIDPGAVSDEGTERTMDAAPAATAPALGPATRLEGRVLVVEDNPVNQKLVRRMLERFDLVVEIADNGAAAVRMALDARDAREPYDLVLMDMLMPVMDGYDATRTLREAGYDEPIVALTANAMAGDREKCLAAGCDDFLAKPIDREALHRLLATHLSAPVPA